MNGKLRKEHKLIAHEFEECIKNTIARLEKKDTHRPFHTALLSKDALFWSRFERSFSTSFGQRAIQRISQLAALGGGASEAVICQATQVHLTSKQLAAIDGHISAVREGRLGRRPNWALDLAEVMKGNHIGEPQNNRVISDLWWLKDKVSHYLSIKTVMPNIDQTAEAKRDLLKLKLNDQDSNVYFGLYYNPYGESRADYNHTPPMGVFDFRHDPVVLIGRDYWDILGGPGCYDEIRQIAQEVGERTRPLLDGIKRQ